MTSKRPGQLRDLRMEIRDLQERLHDEQLPASDKAYLNKRLQKCLEEGRELVRFIKTIPYGRSSSAALQTVTAGRRLPFVPVSVARMLQEEDASGF